MRRSSARGLIGAAAAGAVLAGASPAHGRDPPPVAPAAWIACGVGFECADVAVPRDYARPRGRQYAISLMRRPATAPAERLGSLFLNPGGPGGSGVGFLRDSVRALAFLNRRFDLVGFDPRGVGSSRPSVRCLTDGEALAQFGRPLPTPVDLDVGGLLRWGSAWVRACLTRNGDVLPYLGTANAARDLDRLRAAVGDERLTYLGYSYGTQLGATYGALFPARVRALVLDGAVDPDVWINRPLEATREQVAGFERSLSRFFAACAAGQATWCRFGAGDPEDAFDRLAERLDAAPLPSDPLTGAGPVTGDTVRVAAAFAMYRRSFWNVLAGALMQAQANRGALLRGLADEYWDIGPDGAYGHHWDRYLAISALDQRASRNVRAYLAAGRHGYAMFPHFWWSSGYMDLPWALYPVRPRGVYRGPFALDAQAPEALVIGTAYDPATPYAWARRLTAQLGHARLLTLIADGHTSANADRSTCVEDAVRLYVEELVLPAAGTVCRPDRGAAPARVEPIAVW